MKIIESYWQKNTDGSETYIHEEVIYSKWETFKGEVKKFIRKKITKRVSIADLF